jgi:hypothetical protein
MTKIQKLSSPETQYLYFLIPCESLDIARDRIGCVESIERREELVLDSVGEYGMWCKSRDRPSSLLSRVSACLHECPTRSDMIIDDEYISSLEVASLEEHLDLCR